MWLKKQAMLRGGARAADSAETVDFDITHS
jgi:hypothetical protein